MIEAIAFDWGGIFTRGTFDSDAVRNLTRVTGLAQETIEGVYFPLMVEFEKGAFDLGGFISRFSEQTGSSVDEDLLASTFLGSGLERTEMFDILDAIPEQYLVGMLSNNVPALCDRVRSDLRMQRITKFVFSNEIGIRKPDSAAFHALSEALAVAPEVTVFIDDNADNISRARELGFKAIHLDSMENFYRQWQELLPDIPLPAAQAV
jgi:putative hydrolase of the HAD superfamily